MDLLTWQVMCTVYQCPKTLHVQVARQGSQEQIFAQAIAALRSVGWGADRLGTLCDVHKATHRVGRA